MEQRLIDVLRRLNRVTLLHKVHVHNLLSDTGVWGSQIPILLYVSRNPGCTQTDIAAHLMVSSPSIATSIKRLQKAGMLEKKADAADMRCNHITLTPRGQRTVDRGRGYYEQVTDRMLQGLSAREIDLLSDLLVRMENNLAGEEYRDKTLLCLAAAADGPQNEAKEEAQRP